MAIGVGNLVSAADYNAIYDKINKVLGDDGADEQVGYGRALSSSAVSSGDVIDSALLDSLYADLVKARTHQKGSAVWDTPPDGINAPDTGEYIGAFAADIGATDSSDAIADEAEGFLDFAQASQDLVDDHDDFSANQVSVEVRETATRTTAWNNSLEHTVDLVFVNANERRYFFNSGGLVIFDASLTGGNSVAGDQTQTYPDTPAYQKDEIWQTMLNNMGTIYFGKNATTISGTGTTAAIGNYDLTTSYQTIFTKSGSGVYSENFYKIEARTEATNKLRFRVTFSDSDVGDDRTADVYDFAVDENVTGTINSTVSTRAATGALEISHPGSVEITNLSGGALATSYILTPSATQITEGDSVTVTLDTTGLSNNTNLAYTISGINAADLTSGSITGDFTIQNNTASLSFTLADDGIAENTETMLLSLDNGQASASIGIIDGVVAPTYAITNPNPNVIDEGSLTTTGPFYGNGYGASWVFSSPDYFLFITWNGNSVYTEIRANQPQEGDTFIGDTDGATYTIGAFQSAYNYAVSRTVPTPGSGTFTVATTNVPNGTVLYWTISHLTTSDADFDAVQGTVTINNNAGSINVNTIPDATTEGQESFILRLREGSYAGTIVASGGTGTTVGDTSTTPAPSTSPQVEMPETPWQGTAFSSSLSGQAQMSFIMNSNGTAEFSGFGYGGGVSSGNLPQTWLQSGSASDYEGKWDYTTSLDGGGLITADAGQNVWLNLGATRTWTVFDSSSAPGLNRVDGTFSIRRASDQQVLASGFVRIGADQEP